MVFSYSPFTHWLFGLVMAMLIVAFLLPAIMHILARIRKREPARMPLSLRNRCISVLLAYLMLVGPGSFEQIAKASTQYSQLGTSSWGEAGNVFSYCYDDNGSKTHKFYGDVDVVNNSPEDIITNNPTIAYDHHIYNLQNRLARLEKYDQTHTLTDVIEYKYNDNGVRVQKIDDPDGAATTTTYLVDAYNHTGYAQVLEESGANLKTYTIGDDILTQATDSGAGRHLLYDGHGSTRQLVSGSVGSTNIVDDFSYDGYGVMLQDESVAQNAPGKVAQQATSLLYAGEHFDTDSQNYYLRARWYDSLSGRFNRMDPFAGNNQDPQSLHKYLYVHNNPVNGIDPTGLMEFSLTGLMISIAIGAVIGAIAGGVYAHYTKQSVWKGILIGAGIGAVLGAAFYLLFTGITSGALQRFFWNPRTFQTISRQHWRQFGPTNGSSLHHWLVPQRWSWIPQGIRNAGFNLLRLPKILPGSLGLNQWIGFALRWGGSRMVVAVLVENGIRILIPITAYATYHAGKWAGNELAEEAIELIDGGTATPIKLNQQEELEMQDDAGEALLEEVE